MKSTSQKGLKGGKAFTPYTGNVKSKGSALAKPDAVKKSGGKVKSNVNVKTKAVAKKLKG
jgi:hypothetical protein